MKKKFWDTTLGKITKGIIKIATSMIIGNQKGIKNTPNKKKIDDIIDEI